METNGNVSEESGWAAEVVLKLCQRRQKLRELEMFSLKNEV